MENVKYDIYPAMVRAWVARPSSPSWKNPGLLAHIASGGAMSYFEGWQRSLYRMSPEEFCSCTWKKEGSHGVTAYFSPCLDGTLSEWNDTEGMKGQHVGEWELFGTYGIVRVFDFDLIVFFQEDGRHAGPEHRGGNPVPHAHFKVTKFTGAEEKEEEKIPWWGRDEEMYPTLETIVRAFRRSGKLIQSSGDGDAWKYVEESVTEFDTEEYRLWTNWYDDLYPMSAQEFCASYWKKTGEHGVVTYFKPRPDGTLTEWNAADPGGTAHEGTWEPFSGQRLVAIKVSVFDWDLLAYFEGPDKAGGPEHRGGDPVPHAYFEVTKVPDPRVPSPPHEEHLGERIARRGF